MTDAIGVALPMQAVKHMYVVTEPIADLPKPYPVFRDMETNTYVKGDPGKLLIGWFENGAQLWDPYSAEGDRPFLEMPDDWDHAEPFIQAAIDLIPSLANAGIQHFLNGPESFTHDGKPLVGKTTEVNGLFVGAAMKSLGVMSSAGIGKELAEWTVKGRPASDIWKIDTRRIDERMSDPGFMASRMEEIVGNIFNMHWPYKQPRTGRDLRLSPLHERLKQAGAVFGVGGAWERTLWFAKDDSARSLPYSVGAQAWQPITNREARELAEGVSLIDLSPFSKFDVYGSQAMVLLQYMCAGNMDAAIGRAIYSVLLNEDGGIESDLTVTRTRVDRFRLTSASATRHHRGRDRSRGRDWCHGAAVAQVAARSVR